MIARWLVESMFLVTALMVLGGGVLAVSARKLVRAVFGLIICLIGVAGLYFQLGSPFMFAMQILIYVGAVCIIIVFAIMLADPGAMEDRFGSRGAPVAVALLSATCVFIVILNIFWRTVWLPAEIRSADTSLQTIGKRMLLDYGLVFELISLVLLVAIIGAIVLARGGRDTK
jgi:NADH-quinone oxidoreductase subunit J